MGNGTYFYLSGAVVIYRTSSNFLLLHSFLFIRIFFSVFCCLSVCLSVCLYIVCILFAIDNTKNIQVS